MKRFLSISLLAASTACGSSSSAPAKTASVPQELDIDEGTFTVQPGEEVVYCVRVPMPAAFQGRDLGLLSWQSDITSPAHHYFMFFDPTPTTGTQPVPCQGGNPLVPVSKAGLSLFSTGTLIFVAGVGHDSDDGLSGYGPVLPANGTFVTNHHVINSTAQPLTIQGTFKLMVTDAASVPHPTRPLSCQTTDISIAATGNTDVTATCLAPFDLDVVSMSSHAHQDLTTFEQRLYDGTQTQPDVLYTSSTWDSPVVIRPATPLHLKAGQGITFTCHYYNATGAAIGFGLGASQEMCAAMDQYAYPVGQPNVVPPMLGATVLSNGTPATVSDTKSSFIPLF